MGYCNLVGCWGATVLARHTLDQHENVKSVDLITDFQTNKNQNRGGLVLAHTGSVHRASSSEYLAVVALLFDCVMTTIFWFF